MVMGMGLMSVYAHIPVCVWACVHVGTCLPLCVNGHVQVRAVSPSMHVAMYMSLHARAHMPVHV